MRWLLVLFVAVLLGCKNASIVGEWSADVPPNSDRIRFGADGTLLRTIALSDGTKLARGTYTSGNGALDEFWEKVTVIHSGRAHDLPGLPVHEKVQYSLDGEMLTTSPASGEKLVWKRVR